MSQRHLWGVAIQHTNHNHALAELRHTEVRHIDLLHSNAVTGLDQRIKQTDDEPTALRREEPLDVLEDNHTRSHLRRKRRVHRDKRVPQVPSALSARRREPLARWATRNEVRGLVQARLGEQITRGQVTGIRLKDGH